MFNQLIESKPRKQKMAGGTLFSLVFHGALIVAAVVFTANAGIADDKTKAEKIQFVEMKKEPPKPKPKEPPPPPKEVVMKAPPPKGFQVLRAPVEIPIKIPEIDLTKKVTDEADFSGKGVKGGVAKGVEGGTLWRRVAGDGSGKHPTPADTVTVHYTGTFVEGGVFDTSEGGEPATFPLGRLIPAWTKAIPQMGVGDTIEIAAPASEAYGTKGKGPIPGGATLLFTVRLLKIGG